MKKVKIISNDSINKLEEDINRILTVIDQNGWDLIDIKFQMQQANCRQYAFIIYNKESHKKYHGDLESKKDAIVRDYLAANRAGL